MNTSSITIPALSAFGDPLLALGPAPEAVIGASSNSNGARWSLLEAHSRLVLRRSHGDIITDGRTVDVIVRRSAIVMHAKVRHPNNAAPESAVSMQQNIQRMQQGMRSRREDLRRMRERMRRTQEVMKRILLLTHLYRGTKSITSLPTPAGMRNLTRLAEAQAGDSDGHTVAAVLKVYVDCFLSQTDAIPLTPNDTRGVYLLFFDGGSRGDPGPGGTGSIIVRVHKDSHTASLIWAASMAYSRKDTTNNFAEYWGLIHGLREAQRSQFEPLYVIGDSALIISQQRMHRSPRQHRLARLYQTSRRLADCIDIRGWYHHYRAFNKMADSNMPSWSKII
ncbi:reverse transcriptase, partial [Globisporangium splendens]